MSKEEMKNLIIQMSNGKPNLIVATVPENGDEMAIFSFIGALKPLLFQDGRPLRLTSAASDGIKSNTFGELDKILDSEEYFNKFYELATQFSPIGDIYVLN